MRKQLLARAIYLALAMTVALVGVFTTARMWSHQDNQLNKTPDAKVQSDSSIRNPQSAIRNRVRPPVHYDLGPRGEPYLRFGALQPLPTPSQGIGEVRSLALADLNNDGINDLLAATAEGNLVVYPGVASGSFEPPLSFALETRHPRAIVTGDFNFDANVDVAIAGSDGVEVLYNNGVGNLSPPVRVAVTANPTALVAEDFNQDGFPELMVAGAEGLSLVRGEGPTGFVGMMIRPRPAQSQVARASGATEGQVHPDVAQMMAEAQRQIRFAAPEVMDVSRLRQPTALALADLDGDFRNDLVIADAAGGLAILYTDQQGSFSQPQWIDFPSQLPAAANGQWLLAAADMNDDRLNDLIVSDGRLVTLLLNQGRRGFQQLDPNDFGFSITSLQAVRVNADYAVDLLLVTSDQRLMTVLGDGRGGFNPPVDLGYFEVAQALATRLNPDALTDLILVGTNGQISYALAVSNIFVVDDGGGTFGNSDFPDFNPGDGVCVTPLGKCTLRAAIEEANALPGADTIHFDFKVHAITLNRTLGALPALTDDGTTIDGFSGGPCDFSQLVFLDGVTNNINGNGLRITGDNCAIRGLMILGFDDLNAAGVEIESSVGNVVKCCAIGSDPDFISFAFGNRDGVRIEEGASNNTIGGPNGADRNVMTGNLATGIRITGFGTSLNLVQGNKIGTDAAGNAAVGNGTDGIILENSASGNTIGGTASGARNIISGNAFDGVLISGSGTTGNLVQGNFIGATAVGTAALGNGFVGVEISGAPSNTIGGATTAPGAPPGNVISGNGFGNIFSPGSGIFIGGTSAAMNLVQGNLIGTNATGTAALGNALAGVEINGAVNTTIGGTVAGARNVISGNAVDGVSITGSGARENKV